MKVKDILLVGAGAVVGYFLVGLYRKSKDKTIEVVETTESIVDQAKIDACNKEVENYMASVKLVAGSDLEAIKKAKFDTCMSKKA